MPGAEMSIDVPSAGIAWLVENADSNTELADLSNINQHWRNAVMNAVLEQAQSRIDQDLDAQLPQNARPLLLLPSMIHFELSRDNYNDENSRHMPSPTVHTNSETFCAAWFAPSGIQCQTLSETDNETRVIEDICNDDKSQSFNAVGRIVHQQYQRRQASVRSKTPRMYQEEYDREIFYCPEWRGYREPMDVLHCFGYARSFVHAALEEAVRLAYLRKLQESGPDETVDQQAKIQNDEKQYTIRRTACPEHETTCAVRGSTFARPYGYCLCWDEDRIQVATLQQYEGQREFRRRRHQFLRQDALPSVVIAGKGVDRFDDTNTTPNGCVQFLNATKSHAVRMKTLPFACGVLDEPITMLCVGIATEDGCFVSGLSVCMELGHGYPNTGQDELIDMSPVCMTTEDCIQGHIANNTTIDTGGDTTGDEKSVSRSRAAYCGASQTFSEGSACDSDSSNVSCDDTRRGGLQCQCLFNSLNQDGTEDSQATSADGTDASPSRRQIRRGQRGPGAWHCYVAVFDGENSMLRIDGMDEPLQATSDSPSSLSSSKGLDGLTIGSDHCFDSSLCMGNASDGGGEGAIAELIVMKGRLNLQDLNVLERTIMQKHGLATSPAPRKEVQQMDNWRRLSRAMIAQPPPWILIESIRKGDDRYNTRRGIPLNIMAKDRAVAWHRRNAVTGQLVHVNRIGSKFSTGSSDW